MGARRWWQRRSLWGVTTLLVVMVGWFALSLRPSAEARDAMRNDSRVQVAFDKGVYQFTPMSYTKTLPVGLLIFPENLVDPIAYAPYARAIAAAGYPVILAPLAQRGVLRGSDPAPTLHVALGAVHEDERAAQWIMAGHGRGASLAARVALELHNLGSKAVGGVLMIGTEAPRDSVLMSIKVPFAKIIGTRDWRASASAAEANRRFLPPQARFVKIDGGNHAQFTSAGWFVWDGIASISRAEQEQQLVNATLELLRVANETQRNASWLAK